MCVFKKRHTTAQWSATWAGLSTRDFALPEVHLAVFREALKRENPREVAQGIHENVFAPKRQRAGHVNLDLLGSEDKTANTAKLTRI